MVFLRILVATIIAACTVPAARAGTVTYFQNDFAGSPVVATDEDRKVIWRESYRPYGERLTNSAAAKDNKVWFTSRRQDADTGLVYMGARYYDPVLGRFISMDPVGFDEANVHSHNRYAYANDNPLRYKDPDGRAAETVFDAVSFGISLAMYRNDPSLGNLAGAVVDGLALAVPFVPGGVGAIRAAGKASENGKDTAAVAAQTAESSKYLDVTVGSSVANRATDASRSSFEKNLAADGWSKAVSKDESVTIFSKDGARYVLRENAKSTGGQTADYFRAGSKKPDLKIRLE